MLQRLDAMDQRLDLLEDARRPAAAPGLPQLPDELDTPALLPAGRVSAHAPLLEVRVTASGLELDGKAVTRDDALARFRDVVLAAPHTRLTVVSEPEAPYTAVVDALDLAREAGLTDIAMSTRIHAPGEGEGEGEITAGR